MELYQRLKAVITVSLLDALHKRNSSKKKRASSLAVSLGKALREIPPSSRGRQEVGPGFLPVVVACYY